MTGTVRHALLPAAALITLLAVVIVWSPPVQAAAADPWFGRDKALHFGASALIAATGYGVTTALDDRRAVAFAVGGGLALTAGLAKETLDAFGYGTPSVRDVVWDVLGTLAGLAIAHGIDLLLRREPAPMAATVTAQGSSRGASFLPSLSRPSIQF